LLLILKIIFYRMGGQRRDIRVPAKKVPAARERFRRLRHRPHCGKTGQRQGVMLYG
jgi:hypothetical protein